MTVRVRRAGVGDWHTVRQARLAALTDSPKAFVTTVAQARQTPDQVWQERVGATPHFLAHAEDAAVGLAVLLNDDPAPQLVAVWVRPDQRGTGVVDALVGCAADEARRQGHSQVRLWVVTDNERALRAYARLGFRRTGAEQPVPGRPEDIELEMALSLLRPRGA